MTKFLKAIRSNGLTWNAINALSVNTVNFIIGVTLARLLSPSEFGIVAIVLAFSSFVNSFIDAGFGSAIVQSQSFSKTDLPTIFLTNMFLGLTLATILYSLSGIIGSAYNLVEVSAVLKAMTAVYFLQSFIVVPKNYLVRIMNFELIAKIEVLSTVISGFLAVYLALNGYSYWALVIRIIVQFTISAILYNILGKAISKLHFEYIILKKYWKYGSGVLGTSLLSSFKSKLDVFIIARLMSSDSIGLYTRGKQYAELPQNLLYNIFNKPLFSKFSRYENCIFFEQYIKWFKTLSFVVFLVFGSLYLSADLIIISLLGEAWKGAVIYFQLFSIWGALKFLVLFNIDMFNSRGKPQINLKITVLELIVFVALSGLSFAVNIGYQIDIYLSGVIVLSVFNSLIVQLVIMERVLESQFFRLISSNWMELFLSIFAMCAAQLIRSTYLVKGGVAYCGVGVTIFVILSLFFGFMFRLGFFQFFKR